MDGNKRRRQVHELIAQGLSNKEIGRRISLAESTVKIYVSQLFDELGVRNRTQAALRYSK